MMLNVFLALDLVITFAFSLNWLVTVIMSSHLDLDIFTKQILLKIRSLLEAVNWEDFLNPLNIYSAWNLFVSKFSSILNECIPLDILKPKNSILKYCCFVLRLKNSKCKLWNKYMITNYARLP